METKEARHAFIRSSLATRQITSQLMLVRELTRAGFSVTQSSVSRDLAELGVAKANGKYVLQDVPSIGVESCVAAGPNLLVLRTGIGAAQAVAYRLDQLNLSEIVGTIAGDDTIFVACASRKDQEAIQRALGVGQ
ncbi:MAG: hypothetical protein KF733_03160 [Fimbriimonadaceae bacterium]|nr:MAG: hypothetical protein KF733_03160 [Fimbriimonadaceae bacterium]